MRNGGLRVKKKIYIYYILYRYTYVGGLEERGAQSHEASPANETPVAAPRPFFFKKKGGGWGD